MLVSVSVDQPIFRKHRVNRFAAGRFEVPAMGFEHLHGVD